ncbi:uracil-DNA glycosylase [Desulfovibrio mangrovi]|uniref:uracil-DNA glycosylase n=1 Tax=Desulfovibrio mangrovi TaxID=2976983 RepID=UPI002247E51E|nr:uracil-DNA glycosylase [Desulfovibrio mangrovi]UZP67032.1 uracil-DNA glycosylase [Desulfovibrio mangrovi]
MARRKIVAKDAGGAQVPTDWLAAVPALTKGEHLPVLEAVAGLRGKGTVYPPEELVFNALHLTPLESVRVVIVGQDPYHGPGQAHGLSFSVPAEAIAAGAKMPPSLRNIFKEIDAEFQQDGGGSEPLVHSTDLTRWARQGVLLLNTTLTVAAGKAGSHAGLGWSSITDDIIATASALCAPSVFLLWGSHAQQKAALVNTARHLVLESAHPSPLSAYRGFFGCGHFRQANEWLAAQGRGVVEW